MVTWRTYGTWLQGTKKGYVKDGEVIKKNERLRQDVLIDPSTALGMTKGRSG